MGRNPGLGVEMEAHDPDPIVFELDDSPNSSTFQARGQSDGPEGLSGHELNVVSVFRFVHLIPYPDTFRIPNFLAPCAMLFALCIFSDTIHES